MRAGRIGARNESRACACDTAKRVGGGPGGCGVRRIGRRSDDRKAAGHERAAQRGVARVDEQPLLEARRVREDDVEVTGRR